MIDINLKSPEELRIANALFDPGKIYQDDVSIEILAKDFQTHVQASIAQTDAKTFRINACIAMEYAITKIQKAPKYYSTLDPLLRAAKTPEDITEALGQEHTTLDEHISTHENGLKARAHGLSQWDHIRFLGHLLHYNTFTTLPQALIFLEEFVGAKYIATVLMTFSKNEDLAEQFKILRSQILSKDPETGMTALHLAVKWKDPVLFAAIYKIAGASAFNPAHDKDGKDYCDYPEYAEIRPKIQQYFSKILPSIHTRKRKKIEDGREQENLWMSAHNEQGRAKRIKQEIEAAMNGERLPQRRPFETRKAPNSHSQHSSLALQAMFGAAAKADYSKTSPRRHRQPLPALPAKAVHGGRLLDMTSQQQQQRPAQPPLTPPYTPTPIANAFFMEGQPTPEGGGPPDFPVTGRL